MPFLCSAIGLLLWALLVRNFSQHAWFFYV